MARHLRFGFTLVIAALGMLATCVTAWAQDPTTGGPHLALQQMYDRGAQVIRDVALASKAALLDHFADWEAAKPDQEALLPWLNDQSIHPGYLGHREIAKLIFRELDIFDEESATCRLETP